MANACSLAKLRFRPNTACQTEEAARELLLYTGIQYEGLPWLGLGSVAELGKSKLSLQVKKGVADVEGDEPRRDYVPAEKGGSEVARNAQSRLPELEMCSTTFTDESSLHSFASNAVS